MAKSKPNPKAKGKTPAKGAAKAAPKPVPKPKPLTKTGIYQALAEKTGLERKKVVEVFNALLELIKEQVGPNGPGVMKLPGLIKLTRVEKDAVPAGERMDKFTKQMKYFDAKPAKTEIRARALKELKDLVSK